MYFWNQNCLHEEQNGKERFISKCLLIMQVHKALAAEFGIFHCTFSSRVGLEAAVSTSAS